MAMPLELFGERIAFSCLTRIVKIAVVISVKMVLQFYWNLKRKLQEYVKDVYYFDVKHERLYFKIQFINLLCLSEEMKVITSKVTVERHLNFQKKYAIHAELNKKNHQSKLSAQNKSSVAMEEKLKKN